MPSLHQEIDETLIIWAGMTTCRRRLKKLPLKANLERKEMSRRKKRTPNKAQSQNVGDNKQQALKRPLFSNRKSLLFPLYAAFMLVPAALAAYSMYQSVQDRANAPTVAEANSPKAEQE